MKWFGYFLLLGGMGIVTLSMGWIAGYHGLGTIITISIIPIFLAFLLSIFITSIQGDDSDLSDIERQLSLRTSQLQEANGTIRRISIRDKLTGLYNKRGFKEMIKREIHRSTRLKSSLVILAINFRSYDDDSVKRYSMMSILGKRLVRWMRETDIFARVNEDTLAFLLLDTDIEGAKIFLERLQERLNTCSFQFPPFSTGLTIFPDNGDTPDTLIQNSITIAANTKPGEVNIFENKD
jgi:diguanylate cyclase (GGDEF)-like protein